MAAPPIRPGLEMYKKVTWKCAEFCKLWKRDLNPIIIFISITMFTISRITGSKQQIPN